MHNVKHSTDNIMYTYNLLDQYFKWGRWMNTAGRRRGLTKRSRDTLHRPRGTTLIGSTRIRWFSRLSGWGGCSLLSEAKSPKTTQRGPSGSSPLRLDSSRNGQGWGWTSFPCAQGLYSLKLKPRGTIRLESTQIRWLSWLSDRGCTRCLVVTDTQVKVGK
jgi:hypothetical protein